MAKRAIIRIDEEKCNGCGLCVPSCAEGAIQIVDGKARLVSDRYCDGLGACLGECPRGALTIEAREACEFDMDAAMEHLKNTRPTASTGKQFGAPQSSHHPGHVDGGCPGSRMMTFEKRPSSGCPGSMPSSQTPSSRSELTQWPVQLGLVSPTAPYFKNADLLISADCVPFAMADFHGKFLRGRSLVIGCPKLDDVEPYIGKLAELFAINDLKSITVLHMEVPCCFSLVRLVGEAMRRSGVDIPLKDITVSLDGEIK